MTSERERQFIAHHEAGHAVVAWLCHHVVGMVTIERDEREGIGGRVDHSDQGCNNLFGPFETVYYPDAPGRIVVRTGDREARYLTEVERFWTELLDRYLEKDDSERVIMVAAAGELAQQKFDPQSVSAHQASDDWQSVYRYLEALADERDTSVDEMREALVAETSHLLNDPGVWNVVTNLADVLLERETIGGEKFQQVILAAIRGE